MLYEVACSCIRFDSANKRDNNCSVLICVCPCPSVDSGRYLSAEVSTRLAKINSQSSYSITAQVHPGQVYH